MAKFVERADKRTIDLKKSKRKFKKKEKKSKNSKNTSGNIPRGKPRLVDSRLYASSASRINERGERTLTNLRDDAEESEKDVGANAEDMRRGESLKYICACEVRAKERV